MSTAMAEPLRAVPPLTEVRARFAHMLAVRETLRRAADKSAKLPRQAATYVWRLLQASHLQHLAGRVPNLFNTATTWLGRAEVASVLIGIGTTRRGQNALATVATAVGRSTAAAACAACQALEQGMRLFGHPGVRAADRFAVVTSRIGRRVQELTTVASNRAASAMKPESIHIRVAAALSQSYLLHRALQRLIPGRLLRVTVETLLVPEVVNRRAAWHLYSMLRQRPGRRVTPPPPKTVVVADAHASDEDPRPGGFGPHDAAPQSTPTPALVPAPVNRAERRAAQRDQVHSKRHPVQ
jgi:hypothetical protein